MGRIEDGRLIILAESRQALTTDKRIQFAAIPKFDQLTQAVFQAAPVDRGKHIEAGVIVRKLDQQDELIEPIKEEPLETKR